MGEITETIIGQECMMNDLVITNTFFEYQNIQKFTREVISKIKANYELYIGWE